MLSFGTTAAALTAPREAEQKGEKERGEEGAEEMEEEEEEGIG